MVVRRETYEDLAARDARVTEPLPRRAARPRHGRRRVRRAAARARRPDRADHRAAAGALRRPDPHAAASFDEILERSDLIVELIGGIEPARDYVLRAMRAGRHVVTANKQLLSQHGEELWEAARDAGRAAALRGRRRRRRAGDPRAPGVARRRHDRPRPRDRQRHHELHPHRDGAHRDDLRARRWPRRSGSATPRPTRPRTSTAATPPRRWRSSRGWRSTRRSTSTRCATRGSSTSSPTTSSTRASSGSGSS